ncbi:MAG: hypothetical protein AAF490_30930 [Chloroflexota bacterium]
MDPKNVALSMIVHGDLFWIHVGRALQVASSEQAQAIKDMWPAEYGRFEKSAPRIPYQYKLSCQIELVMRSLKGKTQNWKAVSHKAKEMGFNDLAEELEQRSNYRLLLDLSRRFGVSKKSNEDLTETAVG